MHRRSFLSFALFAPLAACGKSSSGNKVGPAAAPPAGTAPTAAIGSGAPAAPSVAATPTVTAADKALVAALESLEASTGGAMGVAVLDTADGRMVGNRLDERFAMCSTFKLLLAAMVLQRADKGLHKLDQRIRFSRADLVHHAPFTEDLLDAAKAQGLDYAEATIVALARAAQLTSDNCASNLLLRFLGGAGTHDDSAGPAAYTAFCRSLGDPVTRLDRMEPAMNLVVAGEVRDTTSPSATAHNLAKVLTGDVLSATSRQTLLDWMKETQTGLKRLRAGFPRDWASGDKTGTMNGENVITYINDIAYAKPPNRAPLIVTSYYRVRDQRSKMEDADMAVLARVGELVGAWATAG